MGVGGQIHPRERPGTHLIGSWMGPSVGLGGCGKSRLLRDLLSVQPVASRYTDYNFPAHS